MPIRVQAAYQWNARVLQDGHVDPITGPRCFIVPSEGPHCGLYLIARTESVLREGQLVIYDEITRKASPTRPPSHDSPETEQR